jgi:hypothetical protein
MNGLVALVAFVADYDSAWTQAETELLRKVGRTSWTLVSEDVRRGLAVRRKRPKGLDQSLRTDSPAPPGVHLIGPLGAGRKRLGGGGEHRADGTNRHATGGYSLRTSRRAKRSCEAARSPVGDFRGRVVPSQLLCAPRPPSRSDSRLSSVRRRFRLRTPVSLLLHALGDACVSGEQ